MPVFSEEEYGKLLTYYKSEDFNQFSLLVINKVLAEKHFTEDSSKVIPMLIAIMADNIAAFPSVIDDAGITRLADTLYHLLMLIDIQEVYKSNF